MKNGLFEPGDKVICVEIPQYGYYGKDYFEIGNTYTVIKKITYQDRDDLISVEESDHAYIWNANCFELAHIEQDNNFVKVLKERMLEI